MNVCLAPLLYVIQPFSVWPSSYVCSIHYAENYPLHQSVVFHPADVSEQAEFPFQNELHNIPCVSHTAPDFNVRYFLLPAYV